MAVVIPIDGSGGAGCGGAPECTKEVPERPVGVGACVIGISSACNGGTPRAPGVVGGLPPAVFPSIFNAPPSQASSVTSSLSDAVSGLLGQVQSYFGIAVVVVVGYLVYRWWRKRR